MHVMGYVSLFSKSMAGLDSSGLIQLREDVKSTLLCCLTKDAFSACIWQWLDVLLGNIPSPPLVNSSARMTQESSNLSGLSPSFHVMHNGPSIMVRNGCAIGTSHRKPRCTSK